MSENNNIRLLRRSSPMVGESILGYLSRTALANGIDKPSTLLELCQLDFSLPYRAANVAELTHILGTHAEEVLYRCYWPSAAFNRYSFLGIPVKKWMINLRRPRVCPQCLCECRIHLAIWDLAVVACCPTHGVKLMDHCPECGQDFDWVHTAIGHCVHCGYDCRHAVAKSAPEPALALTSYIQQLTNDSPAPNEPGNYSFPALRELGLSPTIELIMFLGAHALGRGLGSGSWMSARLSASGMVRLVSAAAQVLGDWPKRFFLLLEAVRRSNTRLKDKTGIGYEFGAFYEVFSKYLADTAFAPVRQEMSFYIQHQWDGGFISQKNIRLNLAGEEHERYVTRASAARCLGVRPTTVSKLLQAHKLGGLTRQMGSRTLTLIERNSLQQHAAVHDDTITFKEARCILGLSERGFRSMLVRKIVEPTSKKAAGAQYSWSFSRTGITALLDHIFDGIPNSKQANNSAGMTFDKTVRTFTSYGLTVGDVVQMILAKALPLKFRDPSKAGLKQCLFAGGQVEEYVAAHGLLNSDFLTLPHVALSLNLKEQVVYELAQKQHIPTQMKECRGRRFRAVHVEDVKRFKRTYVSGSVLATSMNTSPRSALKRLANQDIQPVTGPSVDGCRQYFFAAKQVRHFFEGP